MSATSGVAGRLPTEDLSESACRLTGCHDPELAAAGLVVLGTVVALVVAGAVLGRLDDARDAIAAERERARAEREAFDAFARRVRSLDATPRSDGGVPRTRRLGRNPGRPPDELASVREAYRETVMAVDHHDEEFGETLSEGMAAEFSPEVAATVAGGGRLTPELRTALLRGARGARDTREEILSHLDEERRALAAARETLAPAVETAAVASEHAASADPGTLVADAERLEFHESAVESLVADRQAAVHETEGERDAWYEYVYGGLDAPYPVLSAGTAALAAIADARAELARAMSG